MLRVWFRLKKDENDEMAKRRKTRGKSVRHGNAPSPYNKYNKKEFIYGEDYKKNHLRNGVLFRGDKPYNPSVPKLVRQAAE
jgi:hypothetical protein